MIIWMILWANEVSVWMNLWLMKRLGLCFGAIYPDKGFGCVFSLSVQPAFSEFSIDARLGVQVMNVIYESMNMQWLLVSMSHRRVASMYLV